MKSATLLGLFSSGAVAHYFFPNTILDGVESADWEYIRETANVPSSGPVEDVTSPLMRCYEKAGAATPSILEVPAGSEIGFTSSASIGHPGPSLFYLARVPDGETAATWDGAGDVWFKIDQHGDLGGEWPEFETEMTEISTTIPAGTPSGDYLLRLEHVGLHIAGAPQFYIACAQITVTGGGSGTPGPLVSFPGAYSLSDPGLAVNIYVGEGAYEYPGPEVWSG